MSPQPDAIYFVRAGVVGLYARRAAIAAGSPASDTSVGGIFQGFAAKMNQLVLMKKVLLITAESVAALGFRVRAPPDPKKSKCTHCVTVPRQPTHCSETCSLHTDRGSHHLSPMATV